MPQAIARATVDQADHPKKHSHYIYHSIYDTETKLLSGCIAMLVLKSDVLTTVDYICNM